MASKCQEPIALAEQGEANRQIIKEPRLGDDKLLDAVKDKRTSVDEVKRLLDAGSHDINQLYETKGTGELYSLLCCAVERGQDDKLKLLLDNGAKLNYPDSLTILEKRMISPLRKAIKLGKIEVSRLLVSRGAPVDADLFFTVVTKGFEEVAADMFHRHGLKLLRMTAYRPWTKNTAFRELIRFMPDLAKEVLDKCIVTKTYGDNPNDEFLGVGFNHEFIDDFQIRGEANRHHGELGVAATNSKGEQWGPAKFTKHNHTLSIMIRHKREELLDHPVVSSLLHQKWQKYGLLSYALNFVFFTVYLAFLTSFALVVRNPQNNTCLSMYGGVNVTDCSDFSESERIYPVVSAIAVIITSILYLLYEMTQFYSEGVYSFKDPCILIRPILYLCSIIFTAMPNWVCPCVLDWQWQIGAVAILLAWLDFVLFTSKIPIIGIYVLMFVEICKTFFKLAFLTLLLVVTFGIAFFMIFSDPRVSRSTFGTGFRSLVRTLVMMTGELDYDGIFRLDSSDPDNDGPELAFVYTAYFLWVPFLIVIPVAFTNLLIGLATGDVNEVHQEAKFRLLVQHVDQVLTIEQSLPFTRKKRISEIFYYKEKKSLKEKVVHLITFLGWRSQYEPSVKSLLNQGLSDMAQIKSDLDEIKRKLGESPKREVHIESRSEAQPSVIHSVV